MFLDFVWNLPGDFEKNCFSSSLLGGMLLTAAANSGFEHPCLGGRGDEGIGGQEGDHHHPPGVHLVYLVHLVYISPCCALGENCTAMVAYAICCMPFFKFAPFRLS